MEEGQSSWLPFDGLEENGKGGSRCMLAWKRGCVLFMEKDEATQLVENLNWLELKMMAAPSSISSILLLLLSPLLLFGQATLAIKFSRHDFPSDFVFGAGTSAFQYEGAAREDGRTPSVLDCDSQGDVAADGYHKYKEDVKLMSDTGLEAYRFSISWSRLIPHGRGNVNTKGLEYYNNVLDELAKQGILVHVALNHLDLPQALQDEYGGWISHKIV